MRPRTLPGPSPARETVTLYSDWFDVCYDQPSPSFSYKGKAQHSGVSSLAAGLGASLVSGIGTEELVFYDGLNLLIPSVSLSPAAAMTKRTDTPHDPGASAISRRITPALVSTQSALYTVLHGARQWVDDALCILITFLLAAALVLFVRFLIKRYLDEKTGQANRFKSRCERQGKISPAFSSSGHLLDPDSVHICLIAVRRSAVYRQLANP